MSSDKTFSVDYSYRTDIMGHPKTETATFTEFKNVSEPIKEVIKYIKFEMEMIVLQQYFSCQVYEYLKDVVSDLNEKFPQATFDIETTDPGQFRITANIKEYENLTKSQLDKICQLTNTTLETFDNGKSATFYFDKEGYFDKKYNIFSTCDLLYEIVDKYNMGGF